MILPGLSSDLDDPIFGKAEILDPAANVQPRRLALPPGRVAGIGSKAQRPEQFAKENLKT
jgi:hypothetical protein